MGSSPTILGMNIASGKAQHVCDDVFEYGKGGVFKLGDCIYVLFEFFKRCPFYEAEPNHMILDILFTSSKALGSCEDHPG